MGEKEDIQKKKNNLKYKNVFTDIRSKMYFKLKIFYEKFSNLRFS